MSKQTTLALALPLGGVAWGGLIYLVLTQPPTDLAIAVALSLLGLAITGTSTPVILALHRRRRKSRRPVRATVVWRQAMWVGLFVVLCAVLQLARVLDVVLALAVATVLTLLESFWQRRT